MLKILPVQNKEEQEKFCGLCGIPYDADFMSYAAFDGETFRGIVNFRIAEKSCIIYKIKLYNGADDYLALYLLGKAPLNFADMCGIKNAVFADSDNYELADKLEFINENGNRTLNLEGYFESPCQRHK